MHDLYMRRAVKTACSSVAVVLISTVVAVVVSITDISFSHAASVATVEVARSARCVYTHHT